MKSRNFNYTYSIFLNESKILTSSNLSKEEVFEYFTRTSPIFKKAGITNFDKSSILETLIDLIYDKSLNKEFLDTHTQTDFESNKANLTSKIQNLDDNFLNQMNYYKLSTISNAEEQMNAYKRNLEDRFQEDLRIEVFIEKK